MNPRKRTRRSRIRREVGTEALPKPTRKRRKAVEEPPAEPRERKRRTLPQSKATPYWKIAGGGPLSAQDDTTEES